QGGELMNERVWVRNETRRVVSTTCLRLMLLLIVLSALSPLGLRAQAREEAAFESSVLAAPAPMRDDATVVVFGSDGIISTLREGTNGLICWDNQGRLGAMGPIDAQCTNEGNRPRLEQNHAFESAGGTVQDIEARFRQAEADGTRILPVFGSIYYRVIGDSL